MSGGPKGAKQALGCPLDGVVGCLLGQKLEISSFEKVMRLDAELGHEFVCFHGADLRRLILTEHDFELEEMSEPKHSVDMHPGSPDEEQGPLLADAASLPIRERQRLPENFGRRGFGAKVERLLGLELTRTLVEDELATAVEEVSELEATGFALKERVLLGDFDGAFVCERGDPREKRLDAGDVPGLVGT